MHDSDAIFVGTGLIVAGALLSAMASVLLAVGAARLIRRSVRARRRQPAACDRHDPRDPFRMKASERHKFMAIWAQDQLGEERARLRGDSDGTAP